MKLRKLHIEDYKMFKDFEISFVDEDDKALSIIILAGVNGSGKTTLLEYIYKTFEYKFTKLNGKILLDTSNLEDDSFPHHLEIEGHSSMTLISKYGDDIALEKASLLFDDIVYFHSGTDDISKVEAEFVKYWYNQVKFYNKRNDEITEELQRFIIEILDGLDFGFTYSYIDEDDNIYFQNNLNKKFKISELSTGEQTLLSKVLYLFLKEYKDKVILIDEPELSLHPKWQNQVLKIYENFAKQNNCQIIIATHSPHIIGSAKNEYLRILKKIDDRIEVVEYSESYGLEFSEILTNIMDVEYLRVPIVSQKLDKVKSMIVQNEYDSDEFKKEWSELEDMLGKKYLDLKLLKLEIASRRKNVSNH